MQNHVAPIAGRREQGVSALNPISPFPSLPTVRCPSTLAPHQDQSA